MSTKRKHRTVLTKSEQMARVRTKDTSAELAFRKALWAAGLRYRLHPPLPGKPDLAFIGKRIAVFVDGCFWHGCPTHYTAPFKNADFWRVKIEKNRLRDITVRTVLEAMGWKVLRFWEHEIEGDLENVVERIQQSLQTE